MARFLAALLRRPLSAQGVTPARKVEIVAARVRFAYRGSGKGVIRDDSSDEASTHPDAVQAALMPECVPGSSHMQAPGSASVTEGEEQKPMQFDSGMTLARKPTRHEFARAPTRLCWLHEALTAEDAASPARTVLRSGPEKMRLAMNLWPNGDPLFEATRSRLRRVHRRTAITTSNYLPARKFQGLVATVCVRITHRFEEVTSMIRRIKRQLTQMLFKRS